MRRKERIVHATQKNEMHICFNLITDEYCDSMKKNSIEKTRHPFLLWSDKLQVFLNKPRIKALGLVLTYGAV